MIFITRKICKYCNCDFCKLNTDYHFNIRHYSTDKLYDHSAVLHCSEFTANIDKIDNTPVFINNNNASRTFDKVTDPHFKWGFDDSPIRGHLPIPPKAGFATQPYGYFSNLSFSSCSRI